jgi:hypothetical protein
MKGYITRQIIILLLFVLAIPISIALADYHYASHEGSNEYPYTSWATAADSIQKALNAASAGDTVYVDTGVFVENVFLRDSIALIGKGWDSTTIDGFNEDSIYACFVAADSGSYALIEGFKIQGAYEQMGDYFKGLYTLIGADITLKDNILTGCSIAIFGLGFVTLKDNIFEGNSEENVDVAFFGTTDISNNVFRTARARNISALGVPYVFARNNIIEEPSINWALRIEMADSNAIVANNLFIHDDVETGTLLLFSGSVGAIENNTFWGGGMASLSISLSSGGGWEVNAMVTNNIIQGAREGIGVCRWDWAPCSVFVAYNDFWENENDIYTYSGNPVIDTLEGNIFSNPMIADTVDYWLQAFSPCIDAGDPDILDVDSTRSDIGYTGGPGGISYTYIDLPPAIPDSFHVGVGQDTIFIDWKYATEADFNHYNIYRSNESGFPASPEYYYGSVDTSVFKDTEWNNYQNYYYLFTAIDNQDNESDPSSELAVIFISIFEPDEPFIPYKVELRQNYPNPFNPRTTIVYSVPNLGPQPAKVKIIVYNIMGEEVRNLVDEYQYYGTHSVIWDGTDDRGREVRSGVYFYNLKLWNTALTPAKKMVLVR